MADEVRLVVGGLAYGGWKSVRITRSIESLAGSFSLDVSDRWGDAAEPRPIREEDQCRVEIDGVAVIDGYVDKRSIAATKDARTLAYTGRDRAAALVDNSAMLSKWTFGDVNALDFVKAVAEPFGVGVSLQAGLTLPKLAKVVVSPGDTAYEVIKRVAADEGVLVVSDGAGGILLTRSGAGRATSLIEGRNIHTASVEYDGADRYHRYVVSTQAAATDTASGDSTRVRGEAIDEGVRRSERVLLIRPDKGYDRAAARRRADWEARVRAARAETVTITVLGWTQPSGELWPINRIAYVSASSLIGVDGDLLISQVEYSIGEAGKFTQLRLVRPDAFTPEPKAKVRAGGGLWKEIERGGL